MRVLRERRDGTICGICGIREDSRTAVGTAVALTNDRVELCCNVPMSAWRWPRRELLADGVCFDLRCTGFSAQHGGKYTCYNLQVL